VRPVQKTVVDCDNVTRFEPMTGYLGGYSRLTKVPMSCDGWPDTQKAKERGGVGE
jgi:hypothetical protein